MRLGIMQPYFFPYLGYFAIIKNTDKFIFFDTPQYVRHSWMNRNRVLNANGQVGWITVPVKKAERDTPIRNIEIDNSKAWREQIFGLLTAYKKRAPYYNNVLELLHKGLDSPQNSLSELNIYTIQVVCEYLGIKTRFAVFSKMNMTLPSVNEPDEWALYITEAEGFETYVNPPGGTAFFNREKYTNKGIKLEFLQMELKPYMQRIGRFEQSLSIIDAMMFCAPSEIRDALQSYSVL